MSVCVCVSGGVVNNRRHWPKVVVVCGGGGDDGGCLLMVEKQHPTVPQQKTARNRGAENIIAATNRHLPIAITFIDLCFSHCHHNHHTVCQVCQISPPS